MPKRSTHAKAVAAIVPVGLLALAAGVTGCGGDGSEQLDAAELVSRGDELCLEGQERFAEIQQSELANAKDAVEQTDELVGIARQELDDLRELEPPEELRDPYGAYLDSRAAALALLEQGRDAAAERDAEGYTRAQDRLREGAGERRRLARAVGFEVCSQPAAPGSS